MNLKQSPPPSEAEPTTHSMRWFVGLLPALLFAGSELASIWVSRNDHLWAALPVFVALPIVYGLRKVGRSSLGNIVFMIAIGLQSLFVPLVQRGLGVPNAVISLALIFAIGLGTLPRRYIRSVLLAGLIIAALSVLIDVFGSPDRPAAQFAEGRWLFSLLILVLSLVFLVRQSLSLDLRTKIMLGILGTGGITLAVIIIFALTQMRQITDALSQRLDTSVNQLAEEELINTAFVEANQANQDFENIAEEVVSLAHNWVALNEQKLTLRQGSYWNARSKLVQLPEGQYGNSATDVSSVFVPVMAEINDALLDDLNVSAYLDFHAPGILEIHPSLLALYAIDTRGVTRFYPNIDLPSILPPDFDATSRPHFSITSPLFNPRRISRWTIPYVDATGGGLVVTVAAPAYDGDRFMGIIAADMQLTQITEQISSLKVGQSGYAFMIDDAGRILSMPPSGFEMFGIRPSDINAEEFFKQTILGSGSNELRAVTARMVAGGNGLLTVDVSGVDHYISFAPIRSSGYSLALVVPVSELQNPIIAARSETQRQLRSAVQTAVIILIVLLLVAIAVSLGLSQVISAPIQRLTQVASQISAGDLGVQAEAGTSDEIGTLAQAFNAMTSRLRETLDGLESMVEERTAALLVANERNERRAKQFESIARIARTISSTRDLDLLLSQITAAIHREFGFYHVGIFLLDQAKEYAVLSAANSEGGKTMLERGHRLRVGETGMVGYVTGTGKPRVALDTGTDAIFFNNPYLPLTRSELTLPMRIGEEIVGALDVQSTEANAFSQEDINILSTLADQVGIAIQNAQQFEQTRRALNESDVLSRQFVQTGWRQFTKNRNLLGVRHTGARSFILYKNNGHDNENVRSSKDEIKTRSRGASLSIPIKLRGEVIGSVDVRTPDSRSWDQDELEIVTAIIERAAIAMENARLLAESQKRAAKERTIGEISSKISMQSEINELLRTAAQELGRTLPGAEIAIQFNKDTE